MGKYILKRVMYIVFVLAIISVMMFTIYKCMPGDPVLRQMEASTGLTPEQRKIKEDAIRIKLGLDKPVVVQYGKWVFNMLTGDFGYSIVNKTPVVKMAGPPMRNTVKLNIFGLIFVFCITIPLGIMMAVKKGSLFDSTFQVITVIGYSLPAFIFGLLFIYIFSVKLGVLPISGTSTVNFKGTGFIAKTLDSAKYMVLPLMTYVIASLGGITRYVRVTMLDALRSDYIRTARAKGLREKVVVYSHAFRNSLIPVVTIFLGWFVSIFSGSVVIERTFSWNGMGNVMIDSLMKQDFSVVLTFNMFFAVLALASNLIIDLAYLLVDPRVKLT